ncbi:MAG TPA: D-tyrosyl-tRNA(Tyr) deacylase [Coprothermobacter sp.]|jgi:D-tyrosyl-tRNA(Tyr) deacylase|nr:D-tyrosyl-tRNA(Tyr) deacylase [Coprothermobacter sp.]
MILVISRVSSASITCDGKEIGSIGKGLVCFVGLEKGDNTENVRRGALKVSDIKVFENKNGRLGLSLKDIDGSVMAVSNFTLAGVVEGTRLSFDNAMPFEEAKSLFEEFCNSLDTKKKVCSVFGSYMEITMNHDGPVNVIFRV